MELVQAFNAELSTLYESKPPISKGKMNTITKTAIKAIKMYKHIVQSVERFIAKCRPEYKVPGLYVIDSIVRQSRHQFGYDKDVFGPRFTRNFNQTFQNLFLSCPVEDKPKIVRVLNLWQRNNVFSCDVIQPLLDMANPNAELKSNTPTDEQISLKDTQDKNIVMQLHQLASSLGISKNANGSNLNSSSSNNSDNPIHRFNKKLLEFDYGDDDEDDTPTESEMPLSNTLTTITNTDELNANPLALSMAQNLLSNPDLVQKLQQSITMQSESSGISKMIDNLDITSSSFFNLSNSNNLNTDLSVVEQLFNLRDSLKIVSAQNTSSNNHQFNQLKRDYDNKQDLKRRSVSPRKHASSSKQHSNRESLRRDWDYKERNEKRPERRSDRRNSRERRHRSRSPRSSNKKDLSNSFNSLQQVSTTSQLSPESKEKERERERRKKGVPSIKKNYVTICSTTLWLGHLPKSTTEIDISDAFGEYGDINSIDLISARGCAYVCMNRRQDAYRALQNLKNLKLHNSHIKMAWAPGKGMKGKEFKDYWDVELGVSYIPYDKLTRNTDFELLEDGGMIDEESIPKSLLDLRNEKLKEAKLQQTQQPQIQQQAQQQTQQSEKILNEKSNTPNVDVIPTLIPPTKSQQPPPPPQILPIPPPIPPPISVPLGHTLPPFPIGPIGMPPIPHPLMASPIPLLNHPHQNAPLPPILSPSLHQPPQKNDQINLKLNEDKSSDTLQTTNKQPQKNLFQKPSIPPLNSQLPPNNNPWIANVPPPTLQPPFLSKDDQQRNLGPSFFGPPPVQNDDSFNNQMLEPNLIMDPMIMSFSQDDKQMQFNDINKRDMFNNNWRMKKDQRKINRRFNNSSSNSFNNESNFTDQWIKRKNDNFHSGNKKFKNNHKNNHSKKFNINSNKNWNQRRTESQDDKEDEPDQYDNELNEFNVQRKGKTEISRNELRIKEKSSNVLVDQSNESIVSHTHSDLPEDTRIDSQDNFERQELHVDTT